MAGGPYPAPIRFRWTCLVELPDGNVVYGTSGSDLLDRWGRMLGMVQGHPLTAAEARMTVSRYLDAYWTSPYPDPALDDEDWLEALNDLQPHVVTFIRK
jgi:hypothetical protein